MFFFPSENVFHDFFFTFMWPSIVTNFFIIKPTSCTNFPVYSDMKLYMLRTVPLPIIRSVYTVYSALVYVIQEQDQDQDGTSWSCSKAVYKHVWHIPVPSVEWINSWWWAEELSETCRVSCRSKFGKLVQLVGLIVKKVLPDAETELLNIRRRSSFICVFLMNVACI